MAGGDDALTTRDRLDAALAADDHWAVLEKLAAAAPPDLAAAIEDRYPGSEHTDRKRLAWLLGLLGPNADPALIRLLETSDGDDAEDLLATAVSRRLALPSELLWRLARDAGPSSQLFDGPSRARLGHVGIVRSWWETGRCTKSVASARPVKQPHGWLSGSRVSQRRWQSKYDMPLLR